MYVFFFFHVLIFVTVPKKSQINKYSDSLSLCTLISIQITNTYAWWQKPSWCIQREDSQNDCAYATTRSIQLTRSVHIWPLHVCGRFISNSRTRVIFEIFKSNSDVESVNNYILTTWYLRGFICPSPALRTTSHTRLRARDHHTSSSLIGGKMEPVQVHFTLRLRDQRSMWMLQDGCKVYMDSYMASYG